MGIQLEKPKLFPENKTFVWFGMALVFVIIIRLFIEYQSYQNFIAKPFYYTYPNVLDAYEKSKGDRHYKVLKLRSDEGFIFYTTSYGKDEFSHRRLRLQIFPNKSIGFRVYLGMFYVKSRIKNKELLPVTFKDKLLKKVAVQHNDASFQPFYNAIFLPLL